MYLIWIMTALLYFIFNIIILMAWMSDREYATKGQNLIATLLLALFGLPILLIVFIVSTIVYISEERK